MLLRSQSLLLSVLFVLPLLLVSSVNGKLSSSRELTTDEPDKRVDSSETDENHDAQLSRLQQNLAQLEMATDPPTNDDLFTPAASLDVFKNIDPEEFEWINPNNIEAGKTTCGFLNAELGFDDSIIYPRIKVYMCVQFATNQPAPKGNLVVHCGGPGTLSSCLDRMGNPEEIGQDNIDNYNVISLDQRGLGRSYPSFAHPECEYADYSLPINELEYTKDAIQDILDAQKTVVQDCWSCEECGFFMEGTTKDDGTTVTLHFLEYAGTLQLAEDLSRFMDLIEADKLSLYGVSYGTNVMGTFATVFPSFVDKFVIDSNMDPESQLLPLATGKAVGLNFRMDYMIYTCRAAQFKDPALCPIEDLRQCLTFIRKAFIDKTGEQNELTALTALNDLFFESIGAGNDPTAYGDLCEKASENDVDGALDDLCALLGICVLDDDPQKRGVGLISCDDYDGPTYNDEGEPTPPGYPYCYAVPEEQYDTYKNAAAFLVDGMDYAGGQTAYNDNMFIREVLEFQDQQGSSVDLFIAMLMMNYYWPKNVPLPIRGSPLISGIVSGQLYDSMTQYEWTQKMRAYFPMTTLLTSQSNAHGLKTGGPCMAHIIDYFETGVPGIVDGTVCGDPYPYFDNLVR